MQLIPKSKIRGISMIHKSFDNAHQSKPQHKHNQLGWFWSTEETKPVFLADRAYGSNLPFTSEYFMEEDQKAVDSASVLTVKQPKRAGRKERPF